MKRNIQSFAVVAMLAAAAGFASCQQEDNAIAHASAEEQSEVLSNTRSEDAPLCSIVTDAAGQVETKLKAYADENSTVVNAIFKISIQGPINQTDVDYLKTLPYVDSLSLEKSLYYDAEGAQLTELPGECFKEFKSVAAVVLPESVKILGPLCFYNSKIRAIYMDKVESMQEADNEYIFSFISYDIMFEEDCGPSWHESYGGQFINCTNLKVVKLSDNLSSIPYFAFYGCSALAQIALPSKVSEIRRAAFAHTGLKEVTLTTNLTTLGSQVFRNCSSLTKVTVNDNLRSMGNSVFGGCSKLQSFAFPQLISLGINTFIDDANITTVTWPSSITTIPKGTFNGCANLTFTIPDYITSLGSYAFAGCKAITEMTIPASVETLGDYLFAGSGLTSLVNGINWIPNYCYQGCSGFTEVTIPETMTSIGNGAFANCSALTAVTIKGGTIGSDAFRDCQALKQVTIEKCGDIGESAFYENLALQKVSIQECGNIGGRAFYKCAALSDLYIKRCENMGYNVFTNCRALSKFTIDCCGKVQSAFTDCYALKEVVIGECNELDSQVFWNCTALTKITINKMDGGILGMGCFSGCFSLSEVNLPEGLLSIGQSVFSYCLALEHITIPSTIERADVNIFEYCSSLKFVDWKSNKVTIPNLYGSRSGNPNLLIFAPAGATSDSNNPNVIIDGHASRINLVQGLYECPRSFTADEVIFEIDFGAERWKNTSTGTGVAARWNTIAVPFTVSSIQSAGKGALAPFGSDAVNNGKAKPFWLCEMTSEGFKDATTIEANKPYIFAMPNNPNYVESYNIQDVVTFKGTNVSFAPSSEQPASSPTGPDGWALTPLYHDSSNSQLFAINWEVFTDRNNTQHPVGNCFRLNARTANAFEAVVTSSSATSAAMRNGYISLGSGTTRSTRTLGRIPQREDMPMP